MSSFTQSGPLNEVHSGWMKKKGQGSALFGGKMQRRFFVLCAYPPPPAAADPPSLPS